MPGFAICPYCRATVQPLMGADGRNLCPQCRNLGPAGATNAPISPAYARPTAPGAVASLVLGIVGVMTGVVGIVLGIIAIVMANNARTTMAASPGMYDGEGMVTAGRVLGIVAIVMGAFSVVVAFLMFGVASALR